MINQILGTLYGMAIGDAMGMPSELESSKVKIFLVISILSRWT